MILYESAPEPVVRVGEFDLAGRRVTARAFPYGTAGGSLPWWFDPIERRFHIAARDAAVASGSHDPEPWREAFRKVPPGVVAVTGSEVAEEIRGSALGAAEGAAQAGRGVFLIDPSVASLPGEASRAFVAVFGVWPGIPPPPGLSGSLGRGFCSGLLIPLVPGWTCEQATLRQLVETAREMGARFAAPLPVAQDGDARRAVIEVREKLEPGRSVDFFERVHHGNWGEEVEKAAAVLRRKCVEVGISSIVPRPIGALGPASNAAAAGRLEERAGTLFARDEHRASLLHAAARWIEESGRDLAPIVAEGNFRKIFPFADEVAREAEAAFREGV